MQFRNFVRREKWRLRPLKHLVLPWRNLKRALIALRRTPPVLVSAPDYHGASLQNVQKVHPSWSVQPLAHPFRPTPQAMTSSQPAWLFELRNIDFWARYGGSVVTADNFLLADLSPDVWGANNHPIFSSFHLPNATRLRGRTAIAVTPEAVGNYYHWLIDLIPRLALLKRTDDFNSYDRVLLNGNEAPYERASLEAVGVGKVNYVDAADRFQIEQGTIPSMDHSSKIIAPWKVEILRNLRDSLPPHSTMTAGRIYVSRRPAAVRRVVNESDLEPLLRDRGFQLVELESFSWPQQVALFGAAEVILAPHGAALANIAFCKPGVIIGEMSTAAGYRDYFLQLAASAGLRYQLVEAQPRVTADESSLRPTENEDMIVDSTSLRAFLDGL